MEQKYIDEINNGKTALGIELGSTRIKAVLISFDGTPLADGAFDWHDTLKDGVWTYSLDEVHTGVSSAFAELRGKLMMENIVLKSCASIGVSAMMHGYLAFDKNGKLLTPFRTWRNTITADAADKLTKLFNFNIPQRWSIAHLYQAILNKEEHVKDIAFITTLAGYVHYILTGEKVLGVGDASGMFPIDSETMNYDAAMVEKFDGILKAEGLPYTLSDILPAVKVAGEEAGKLNKIGSLYLAKDGSFGEGFVLCPPEGDAGTGMVATNSVAKRTGNISAGTSIFAMTVLENALKEVHTEIDNVTTPDGSAVAMVHCNTCTSDLDAWVKIFGEFASACGFEMSKNDLYKTIYNTAFGGKADCGGSISFNCYSGEPVCGIEGGRPMFLRNQSVPFALPDFLRSLIYATMAPLKLGMDILREKENVKIDSMLCHGGMFKTPKVAQSLMASALEIPLNVMSTAGEGGPYGMAVLASYAVNNSENLSLSEYLTNNIFKTAEIITEEPVAADTEGFKKYLENYVSCIPLENNASKLLD